MKLYPVTVTPHLAACKDFYVRLFGFEVVVEVEWYVHLRHPGGAELSVMMPGLDNQPEFLRKEYGGAGSVYSFEVDDAAAEYERLKALGAEFAFDLKDEEWGQRHCMLMDPAGVCVDVVQQLR